MAGNLPIKSFRAGNIQGAVWLNRRKTADGEISFKTASLRRSWKQDDGIWRDEVINLRKNDVPKTIIILNKLMEELMLSEIEKEDEEDE